MPSYKKRHNSYELDQDTIKEEIALLTYFQKIEKEEEAKNSILKWLKEEYGVTINHPIKSDLKKFKNFHEAQNKQTIIEKNSLENQLENIKKELIELYQFSEKDFDQQIKTKNTFEYEYIYTENIFDNKKLTFSSRRVGFLIWQYGKLNKILEDKKNKKGKLEEWEEFLESFKKPFDVAKKPLDSTDDIWSIIQKHLSSAFKGATVYIMSVVLGILHLIEGINGAWIVFKTLVKEKYERSENKLRRLGNIITGGLTAIIGATGVALAIKAIKLLSLVLSQVLSGLMNIIFIGAAWRRGIRYLIADKNYENARYEKIEKPNQNKRGIKLDLKKRLPVEIADIENRLNKIRKKIRKKILYPHRSTSDTLESLREQELKLSHDRFELDHQLTHIKRLREKASEKRFGFAISKSEWASSFFVAVGVVTYGALAIIGVVTAFAVKTAEYLDEKYGSLRPVKKWLSHLFNKKPEVRNDPSITSERMKGWLSSTHIINNAALQVNSVSSSSEEEKKISRLDNPIFNVNEVSSSPEEDKKIKDNALPLVNDVSSSSEEKSSEEKEKMVLDIPTLTFS